MNEVGFISEVFLSFQGEGIHVGRLQLFVRLAGCGLRCRYCDTVDARTSRISGTAHRPEGSVGQDTPSGGGREIQGL